MSGNRSSHDGFSLKRLNMGEAITSLMIKPPRASSYSREIHDNLVSLTKLRVSKYRYFTSCYLIDRFSYYRYTAKTLILEDDMYCEINLFEFFPNLEEIGLFNDGQDPARCWDLSLERGIKIHTVGLDFMVYSENLDLEAIKMFLYKVLNLKRIVWIANRFEGKLSTDFIRCFEDRGAIIDRDDRFFRL